MTLPEGMLWQQLRQRPDGLKFRRQHPIGRCIVDFYCAAARVVIEVDGDVHNRGDGPSNDLRRDGWLRRQGMVVLRFAAVDVINDVRSVTTEIVRRCRG
jgi:very-short-patch-repair endonuclease